MYGLEIIFKNFMQKHTKAQAIWCGLSKSGYFC